MRKRHVSCRVGQVLCDGLRFSLCRFAVCVASFNMMSLIGVEVYAAGIHQTEDFSTVYVGSDLGYQIDIRPVDYGEVTLPGVHSFAKAKHDGLWVILSGRTNGLHGFDIQEGTNFPVEYQNQDVIVVDPISKQYWKRSLADPSSGLSEFAIQAMTPANNQFAQVGSRLYMTGGYGITGSQDSGGLGTLDALTAIDLPGMIEWVQDGTGQAADHVRQIQDERFQVTGGAMYQVGGKMHLVLGQNYEGDYAPWRFGEYTRQVRSFEIVDDGTHLSFSDYSETEPKNEFRRRDLNVFPVLKKSDSGDELEEGMVALSGVFTPSIGVWTVPLEIDADGHMSQVGDPESPDAFKQAMGQYHSMKFGMYSESQDLMQEVLLGGISVFSYDEQTGELIQNDEMPFTNDVSVVAIDENGDYSQHYLGEFPELLTEEGDRLYFGANGEFFLADDVPVLDHDIIDLDAIGESMTIGYLYGGLYSEDDLIFHNPADLSGASRQVFKVVVIPVPEPAAGLVMLGFGVSCLSRRRRLEVF